MSYFRLALKAGIDKQNTEYGAEGGFTDGDNVRFRFGLPEKLGGWTYFNGAPNYLVGFASETFSWNNTAGTPYLAVGTNRKIYVSVGGAWSDITPLRETTAAGRRPWRRDRGLCHVLRRSNFGRRYYGGCFKRRIRNH